LGAITSNTADFELGTQGGHVGRPGQELVALDLALDLDDHTCHRLIVTVVQDDHGISAILGRRNLGQIEPMATRA
jgi:hypothetical protein